MYSADDGKPTYNQPQAAATGLPVNYNGSATGYSGASSNYQEPKPLVEWSTGLFDCFSNGSNCCMTCCCPCVTFGRVAEIVDKGSTPCGVSGALYMLTRLIGCNFFYSCCYRPKMREQYGLKGNHCTDCLIHCCCEACALCQEYRELENRGFNMKLGWQGNVEQRTQGVAMSGKTAPAVQHGMTR